MILYLDASAAVKRYVQEPGSSEVQQAIANADAVGTSVISLVEMTAALRRAIHVGTLVEAEAEVARRRLETEWPDYIRVQVTEALIDRAKDLAWKHRVRGYDAVHLASGLVWQAGLGAGVTFATFDVHLWKAAQAEGLSVFPAKLPTLLNAWRQG